eukprot:CAMPEP_0178984974 /NCGR_PEP_ID=MMETSP0795-20121207/1905_1 /TAXON_ID=88552 /ORGANISM="Amoebophrya sp., Strain Ameob2" /LENGTH=1884 /DNA_ID=CAMNT_0020675901 /DNA_START=155 /DNA_END=5809 /DNA_ORIENTATION=+
MMASSGSSELPAPLPQVETVGGASGLQPESPESAASGRIVQAAGMKKKSKKSARSSAAGSGEAPGRSSSSVDTSSPTGDVLKAENGGPATNTNGRPVKKGGSVQKASSKQEANNKAQKPLSEVFKGFKFAVTHGGATPTRKDAYHIECVTNQPESSNVNHRNYVRTARYSALTFIFVNLWEQFQNLANLYFILTAVAQMLEPITDSEGQPTILVGLLPIMAAVALREWLEDRVRARNDYRENHQIVERFNNNAEQAPLRGGGADSGSAAVAAAKGGAAARDSKKASAIPSSDGGFLHAAEWQNLRVGDVIRVRKGSLFPADLLLLTSSDKERGQVFVETKNLDGETNLKTKTTIPVVDRLVTSDEDVAKLRLRIKVEPPNSALYSLTGQIFVQDEVFPLSADQLLLKGSSCQSEYAVGCVIYCGHFTRLLFNATAVSQHKLGIIQRWFNKHVIQIAVMQLLFSIFVATAEVIWSSDSWPFYADRPVITDSLSGFGRWWVIFGRQMLLLTYFVPISVIITVEIIRVMVGWFVQKDEELLNEDENGGEPVPAKVQATSVLEDLGSISHIFSDKTGTLTQNLMLFSCVGLPNDIRDGAWYNNPVNHVDAAERVSVSEADLKKMFGAAQFEDKLEHELPQYVDKYFPLRRLEKLFLPGANHPGGSTPEKDRPGTALSTTNNSSRAREEAAPAVEGSHSAAEADSEEVLGAGAEAASPAGFDGPGQRGEKPIEGTTPRGTKARVEAEAIDEQAVRMMFYYVLNLALCHTVILQVQDSGEEKFEASSPDELALICAASAFGFRFLGRPDGKTIRIGLGTKFARWLWPYRMDFYAEDALFSPNQGETEEQAAARRSEWLKQSAAAAVPEKNLCPDRETGELVPFLDFEILDVLEFDNVRKRMSVIIKMPPDLVPKANFILQTGTPPREGAASGGGAARAGEGGGAGRQEGSPAATDGATPHDRLMPSTSSNKVSEANSLVLHHQNSGVSDGRGPADSVPLMRSSRGGAKSSSVGVPSVVMSTSNASLLNNLTAPLFDEAQADGILLLTKGADNSMLQVGSLDQPFDERHWLDEHILDFAKKGLRTLVLGYRWLPAGYQKQWSANFASIRGAVELSDADKTSQVAAAVDEMEKHLNLVGCTGVEDKLQDQVPETIAQLQSAGIKFWVLTGDKVETAIQIGQSCNLLNDATYNLLLSTPDAADVEERLREFQIWLDAAEILQVALAAGEEDLVWSDDEVTTEEMNSEHSHITDTGFFGTHDPGPVGQDPSLVVPYAGSGPESSHLGFGSGTATPGPAVGIGGGENFGGASSAEEPFAGVIVGDVVLAPYAPPAASSQRERRRSSGRQIVSADHFSRVLQLEFADGGAAPAPAAADGGALVGPEEGERATVTAARGRGEATEMTEAAFLGGTAVAAGSAASSSTKLVDSVSEAGGGAAHATQVPPAGDGPSTRTMQPAADSHSGGRATLKLAVRSATGTGIAIAKLRNVVGVLSRGLGTKGGTAEVDTPLGQMKKEETSWWSTSKRKIALRSSIQKRYQLVHERLLQSANTFTFGEGRTATTTAAVVESLDGGQRASMTRSGASGMGATAASGGGRNQAQIATSSADNVSLVLEPGGSRLQSGNGTPPTGGAKAPGPSGRSPIGPRGEPLSIDIASALYSNGSATVPPPAETPKRTRQQRHLYISTPSKELFGAGGHMRHSIDPHSGEIIAIQRSRDASLFDTASRISQSGRVGGRSRRSMMKLPPSGASSAPAAVPPDLAPSTSRPSAAGTPARGGGGSGAFHPASPAGLLHVYKSCAITITGDVLAVILDSRKLRRIFFRIALQNCSSIIACRVSPIQKATIVALSRRYHQSDHNAMLAIGDGANDVGMILKAHVGVGRERPDGKWASTGKC